MLSMIAFKSPANIQKALKTGAPVVALESTVLTHGLPRPQNLELARDMERAVLAEGAIPATIAFLDGNLHIGLNDAELVRLANEDGAHKVGPRDFATVITNGANGGTTVAGTMLACKHAKIIVFATGGIGGVHRESHFDISADLQALATIPMIVVCAGAKAILDLPATVEYLETMGVPVVGYQTNDFPAFYSRESGFPVSVRIDTPQDIVDFANIHWSLEMKTAVLVTQPIPEHSALPKEEVELIIESASKEAKNDKTRGQALTPFLLNRISKISNGKSLQANLALLLNNAHLAGQISRAYALNQRTKKV